jgi:hypothetical protein
LFYAALKLLKPKCNITQYEKIERMLFRGMISEVNRIYGLTEKQIQRELLELDDGRF